MEEMQYFMNGIVAGLTRYVLDQILKPSDTKKKSEKSNRKKTKIKKK